MVLGESIEKRADKGRDEGRGNTVLGLINVYKKGKGEVRVWRVTKREQSCEIERG